VINKIKHHANEICDTSISIKCIIYFEFVQTVIGVILVYYLIIYKLFNTLFTKTSQNYIEFRLKSQLKYLKQILLIIAYHDSKFHRFSNSTIL